MMNSSTFVVVVGTRPELIKMAPLILEAKRRASLDIRVVNTGQHKELLAPYWTLFGIDPDINMEFMHANQSLSALTARGILQFQEYLDGLPAKPAGVIGQGDTTTVMVVSMVCFYNKIKFIHLEAGLRSFDLQNPFPEEFNRKVSSIVSALHLCPTSQALHNLLREGVDESTIQIVGNTVVDALEYIRSTQDFKSGKFIFEGLNAYIHQDDSVVLITCHRRENHGLHLENIIKSVKTLALQYSDYKFVWVLHPNPAVKDKVQKLLQESLHNILLVPPLEYLDVLKMIDRSRIILTDSGGIQEEAPSFSTPVLVLRESTERPEGITLGYARLVGADAKKIQQGFTYFLENPITVQENPYGSGKSASLIVNLLEQYVNVS